MKTLAIFATGAAVIFALAYCTRETTQPAPITESPEVLQARIKRGEYLVTVGGCNDCHTPKIMTPQGPQEDHSRLLSGHPSSEALPAITDKKMIAPGNWVLCDFNSTAWVGPWGTSFTANLTPDDTGIGTWDYAQFEKAIREGKSKGLDGTRPLLPPMPWFNYAKMTDEDLRAVFAYLKSIPPVKNVVPNPIPPAEG